MRWLPACGKSDLEEMRRFLDAGVDINGVSSNHWTPLTKAASKNQVAAVRLNTVSALERLTKKPINREKK